MRDRLPGGTRLLDLRSGVLWRSVRDEDGPVLGSARWACLARPGTTVLVVEGRSTLFEGPGDPELFTNRATFGGAVVAAVQTRRQSFPAAETGPQTLGLYASARTRRSSTMSSEVHSSKPPSITRHLCMPPRF